MGTAGALALMEERPGAPFVVTNGDVLTDIHYSELLDYHLRHQALATMAVRLHEWQHPYGVVHTDGVDIVGFEEKPIARSHINAGIYVLDPAALDVLTPGVALDMPDLFALLQRESRRTIVYPMHEPWLDVGLPEDFQRADRRKSPG
jgi:NDP-sugar pyrophosphorylase family protein